MRRVADILNADSEDAYERPRFEEEYDYDDSDYDMDEDVYDDISRSPLVYPSGFDTSGLYPNVPALTNPVTITPSVLTPAPVVPADPSGYFAAQLMAGVGASSTSPDPSDYFSRQLMSEVGGDGAGSSDEPLDRDRAALRRDAGGGQASTSDYFSRQLLGDGGDGTTRGGSQPEVPGADDDAGPFDRARSNAQKPFAGFVQGAAEKYMNDGTRGNGWSVGTAARGAAGAAMENYIYDYVGEQITAHNAERMFGKPIEELDATDAADAAYGTRAWALMRNYLKDMGNPWRMGRGTATSTDELLGPGFKTLGEDSE